VNNRWPPTSNIDDLRSRKRAKNERVRTERAANSAIRDDPVLSNHIDNGRSRATEDNVRSWLESEEEGGAGSVGGPRSASAAGASTQYGERMCAGRNVRLHGDSEQTTVSSSGYYMSEDSARVLRDRRGDERWSCPRVYNQHR
jgi:hypothetical protein